MKQTVGTFLFVTVSCAFGLVPPPAVSAEETALLEEVVVTARKREETLADISAAISVVGGDRLRDNIINDVRDLQSVVPTLNIGEVVGLMKINMRGLGNSTNTRSEDPDVVMHVDGAVVSRMEAQALSFFDLERIEVLRGPQGTLYGRNSTGGTINLITAKPTEEFEGYVNLSGGRFDFFKADAAFSGPIADAILGRIAVQSINRGGFGRNITTGNDIDDEERWAVRGQLKFILSDDVDFLLAGEYASEDDASGFFTFLGPLFPGVVTPAGAGGFSDPASRDGASNFDPQLERETFSITGTLNWRIDERFTVRNILNYRNLDFFLAQDLDTSSVPNTTAVSLPLDDHHFSEELQVAFSSERLNALAGAYYFEETFDGFTNIGTTPTQGIFITLIGESNTKSWSGFWNASYDANDWLALRAGGRYTRDRRRITNDTLFNGNLITTDNDISDDRRTVTKYTGEYGIDVTVFENSVLYYTFSQGFRSGAALIFQSNSPIIDPTTVDNHEVGLKFQIPDRGLAVAIAAFTANIEDLQRTQASLTPQGLLTTRVNNVDELDTKGFEIDVAWAPVDRFRLNLAVAYVNAEFKDFISDDPLQFGTELVQVAGNSPRLTPDWKANVHGEYDFPLSSGGVISVGGDVSYVGDQFFDEFNREPFAEDDYTVLDARLSYRPNSGKWEVAIWGKNLTDEKKLADTSFSAFGGVTSKHFINPVTYGVSLNYNF